MLTIALTGGIACGKSTVAGMFRDLGASVVDADEISRSLTAPGGPALPAIRAAFGDEVFAPDGTLSRPALSAKVFGHPQALEKLNAITHPMIRSEMERQAQQCRKAGAEVVVLDVPLLFEAGMQDMADMVLCAVCPQEVQIARMAGRNGFDRETALERIRSQMSVSEKAARSDLVISTDLPLEALERKVEELYRGWISPKGKEHA